MCRVFRVANALRHHRHAVQRTVGQRVAVSVLMSKPDVIPPVRRSHLDRNPPGPRPGIAAHYVLEQTVAILVGCNHLVGPSLDARVIGFQPCIAFPLAHTIRCRDQ